MIVRQPLSPFSHAANIITVNGKRYRATVRGGTAQNTEALQQLAQAVLNGHQGCKKIVVRKTTVIYTNSSNDNQTQQASEDVQKLFQKVFRSTPPTTRPASPVPAAAPQEVAAPSPVPTQSSSPEELSLTIPKPLRPITPIVWVSYPSLATSSQKTPRVRGPGLSQQRGYEATPFKLAIETRRPSVRTLSDQQPDVDPEAPARIPVKIAVRIFLSLLFGHSFDPLPTNFQPPRQDANALASASLLVQSQRQ